MYTSKHFLSKCTQDPHKYSYDKNTGAVNSLNGHSSGAQKWEPPESWRDQVNIQKDVQSYMLPAPQQKQEIFFSHIPWDNEHLLSVTIFLTPVDNLKSQCWYLFSRHVRIFVFPPKYLTEYHVTRYSLWSEFQHLKILKYLALTNRANWLACFPLKMMCIWGAKQIY